MKRPWLEANGNTFPYRKLIHVASLKARIGWQSLRTDEFVDEGPYCVTGTDFQNGKINWSTSNHVSAERYEMDRNIQLAEGDLLVTKDGTIGKVAVVHGMDAPATLNSGVFVVRPKSVDLSSDFLGWVVRSKVFDDFVAFNFSGSTINHLYQNVFETFRFPFPDLATQRQIADFLDRETARIDLLIEKKQRLVALLGERNNVACSEHLRELRDHHGEHKLSHVCLIHRGRFNYRPRNAEELYDGEFPFLQTGDVARAKKFITEHKQTLSGLGASISKRFTKGTVLMAIAANVGDVAILEFDAFCPDSVVGFLPEKKVDTEFLYYVLKGAGEKIATSSTSNAQDNTNIARLGALKIPMPPKKEQVAVASEFARREEQEIKISEQTNASIDRLKEYRSALITAAVTGQIDVATYSKSGTPVRCLDAIREEMGA